MTDAPESAVRRRSLFALHLTAIIVLAVLLLTGLVVCMSRGRIDTLADVTPRLAATAECRVSGNYWSRPPGAAAVQCDVAPATLTDPAFIRRVLAALPADARLRPAVPNVSTTGPSIRLDFPAEDVCIGVMPAGLWVRVGDEYYEWDERVILQDAVAAALASGHPPK